MPGVFRLEGDNFNVVVFVIFMYNVIIKATQPTVLDETEAGPPQP